MSNQEESKTDLSGVLMGMGNPLLDISAEVPQDVLDRYEVSLNNAILAEEKHQPLYKELVDNFTVDYIAGGATQNSIRVAQWMLGGENAGATAYMGCIGNDDFGKQLEASAGKDGVRTHYMKDESTATGTCAVLVKDSERSLVANLAAANNFNVSHLDTEEARQIVEAAKFYYIAGFFLTVSTDSIDRVGQHAAAEGKTLLMNLSAPFLVEFFKDQMEAALPYCDYVFGNESEAEKLGEVRGWGSDLPTIARKLSMLPKASGMRPRIVVFTQGAEATIVARQGEVLTFAVDPLPAELLVDTNGAGDAFVGGFLSQLVQGKDLGECVRAGHWSSRVIIQRSGCSFPDSCDFN